MVAFFSESFFDGTEKMFRKMFEKTIKKLVVKHPIAKRRPASRPALQIPPAWFVTKPAKNTLHIDVGLTRENPQTKRQSEVAASISVATYDEGTNGIDLDLKKKTSEWEKIMEDESYTIGWGRIFLTTTLPPFREAAKHSLLLGDDDDCEHRDDIAPREIRPGYRSPCSFGGSQGDLSRCRRRRLSDRAVGCGRSAFGTDGLEDRDRKIWQPLVCGNLLHWWWWWKISIHQSAQRDSKGV
ncbi:hypothetical protein B0H14DRAFT_2633940 [Mycena olivaceomarginata]|nr:hypothetical protein B0H14DRAFT_2633940 [Mycena olivaceomarginata]